MKKFLKKVFGFFIVLVLILLIKKNITPYYVGDTIFKAKYEDYKANSKKYNSVVFGSSRLYRQLNTLYLDALLIDYNLTTYNFSTGGTGNPESFYLFEKFLNNIDFGSIKFAFIELQALQPYSDFNTNTTKASYWNTTKYLFYSIKYINNSNYLFKKKQKLYKNYLKSYFYGLTDFSFIKNYSTTIKTEKIGENGFYPYEKEISDYSKINKYKKRRIKFQSDTLVLKARIESAKINTELISHKSLNKYHFKYLKHLIAKSSQKGVKLIFILPPRLHKQQYNELIPICNALPIENVIELYSYSKYKEFYLSEYSFDIGHLNTTGANLFTKYLSNEFIQINTETQNTLH